MYLASNKRELKKIDKNNWPEGERTDEPDYIAWYGPALYRCRAIRNIVTGNWCGYVGLPFGYAFACDISDLEVHGGITYDEVDASPHGEELKGWWLGFDCHHVDDHAPALLAVEIANRAGMVYRNKDFIIKEVESFAMQLFKMRLKENKFAKG